MSFLEKAYSKFHTREIRGITYAIKVSSISRCSSERELFGAPGSFIREVTIMKEANHSNIIGLISTSSDFLMGRYSIMMEYTVASLDKQIGSIKNRQDIFIGIARGLYYLEQKNILHGDLNPRNIVLMEDQTPKIVDFELAVMNPTKRLYQPNMVIDGWRSPEEIMSKTYSNTYRGFKMLSWTFGIIMYAVYKRSLKKIRSLQKGRDGDIVLTEYFKLVGTPRKENNIFSSLNYRENLPTELLTKNKNVDKIIKNCLIWNPEERISMREILIELGDNPEKELTVFEKLHLNLPKKREYHLPKSFTNELSLMKDYGSLLHKCAFLAAAIYLKSGVESSDVHYTCIGLAAKVLGVVELSEEMKYQKVDVLAQSKEELEVLERCNYDLNITTSMSYLDVLLEEYDDEDSDRVRKKLFKKLLEGENVLYVLPEHILI